MEQRLKANIRKFYLFNILSSFVLYYAIDKILMKSRGLSVTDMVLVEISYTISRLLLEVPSGALADRWSRKYVLALNMVFFMGTTALWAIAPNLRVFILGNLIAGAHSAFGSGTDTSFLYDTLKQIGKDEVYTKTLGNAVFWGELFSIIAGIGGAMLADSLGLVVPLWVTLPFSLAAVVVALTFTEPQIHRTTREMGFWKHIGETGKYIWRRQFLISLMAFSVIMGITLLPIDEYGQLYYVGVGIPVLALGYLSGVSNGIAAVGGKFAYKLSRFSRKKVFGFAAVLSAAGLIVVGLTNSLWGVPFAFLPFVAFYFTHPLVMTDLHNELPSGQRATGASFLSLLHMLVTIPLVFGFGRAADRFSIATAYWLVGALVSIYLVVFIFSYHSRVTGDFHETP
ncbi:MAG: MFS transporter [Chloroflexi bacterium]|nr:MFS transporter [Chloroflexota bacterium]